MILKTLRNTLLFSYGVSLPITAIIFDWEKYGTDTVPIYLIAATIVAMFIAVLVFVWDLVKNG